MERGDSLIDFETERAALLAIHARDRQGHFQTDAAMLAEHQAETFIYVGNGEITNIPYADFVSSFESSFHNATYLEWDDLEPPILRISEDATLAWMIVRNRVRKRQLQADGTEAERKFIYAGIMTYEKQDGKWFRTANVSTFAPYE